MSFIKALIFFFIISFFPVLIGSGNSFAQCAMCKAVAESSQDSNSIATGLNSGILYLLAIPYALIGGIIFFSFRKEIMKKLKTGKNLFT